MKYCKNCGYEIMWFARSGTDPEKGFWTHVDVEAGSIRTRTCRGTNTSAEFQEDEPIGKRVTTCADPGTHIFGSIYQCKYCLEQIAPFGNGAIWKWRQCGNLDACAKHTKRNCHKI